MNELDIESIMPLKCNTRCGELYFENSIIKCVCIFCKNSFETITIFTKHLLEEHLYFKKHATNKNKPSQPAEPEAERESNTTKIKKIDKRVSPITTAEADELTQSEVISTPPAVQNSPMYSCKTCKLSFTMRHAWQMHYKEIHRKTVIKPFEPNICHICKKSLCSKDSLRRHLAFHAGPERPYKCSYCPHTCTLKGNLTQHEKLHGSEKAQKCDFCDKRFHIRFEKHMHERRVHTKERPYQCEICGKSYFTCTLLKNHKKRHTNTRNFGCNVCGKRFYDRQLLKDHMIAHTNEKPHQCDICMAKFGRRKALLQHIKIHNDVKQYNCALCNKSFAQKPGLYSHMKSHGKQEKL